MRKLIDNIKLKLGILLITKNKTATSIMHEMSAKVENARCIHCGKNPYFKTL